jgi:hypothetical protein
MAVLSYKIIKKRGKTMNNYNNIKKLISKIDIGVDEEYIIREIEASEAIEEASELIKRIMGEVIDHE